MRLDIYIHDANTEIKLDQIILMLAAVLQKEDVMSAEMDALVLQVTNSTTIETSAVTLIQGLAAQIAALVAAGTVTPAQLTQLANNLNNSATTLAAAITANTPGATPAQAARTAAAPHRP